MSAYVKGDPRWITTRYRSDCAGCGARIFPDERAFYWPHGKRLECSRCGDVSERRFVAEVQDEIRSVRVGGRDDCV
jgi:hypothetical protein